MIIVALIFVYIFIVTLIPLKSQDFEKSTNSTRAHLITFADNCCWKSSKKCCSTGMKTGRFDSCVIHDLSSLDEKFKKQYAHILEQKRGRGYWIWKPYIILKTLLDDKVKFGDIVMYSDAGRYFIGDPIEYFNILWRAPNRTLYEKYDFYRKVYDSMIEQDFFAFALFGYSERHWTKVDTLEIIAGAKSKEWKEYFWRTAPASASFFIVKKTTKSIAFVSQWLTYCGDSRLVTDEKEQLTRKNHPEFIENRHDQSILSVLLKKWELFFVRCPGFPSKFPILKQFEEAGFKQFMTYSRDRF